VLLFIVVVVFDNLCHDEEHGEEGEDASRKQRVTLIQHDDVSYIRNVLQ